MSTYWYDQAMAIEHVTNIARALLNDFRRKRITYDQAMAMLPVESSPDIERVTNIARALLNDFRRKRITYAQAMAMLGPEH